MKIRTWFTSANMIVLLVLLATSSVFAGGGGNGGWGAMFLFKDLIKMKGFACANKGWRKESQRKGVVIRDNNLCTGIDGSFNLDAMIAPDYESLVALELSTTRSCGQEGSPLTVLEQAIREVGFSCTTSGTLKTCILRPSNGKDHCSKLKISKLESGAYDCTLYVTYHVGSCY